MSGWYIWHISSRAFSEIWSGPINGMIESISLFQDVEVPALVVDGMRTVYLLWSFGKKGIKWLGIFLAMGLILPSGYTDR